MCGIVGYLGTSQAAHVLLSELKCLEYRGYDSAGVAVIEGGHLAVLKASGKLTNLESLLSDTRPKATVGIGHTRWATHGSPTDMNAHPHTDCSQTLAIVHNGIIENYAQLREQLTASGHRFVSETDTEVIAHLIEQEFKASGELLQAITQAVKKLEGAYAIGVVSQRHPDKIYAVNHHYSLSVGIGENEMFLASDSVAVRQYTNSIIRLGQSEIAELTANKVTLYTFDGKEIDREPVILETNPFVLDKQGHRHFLLKEIHEQPFIIRQTLSKYLPSPDQPVNFNHGEKTSCNGYEQGLHFSQAELKRINRVMIVACGTAYYAGLVGKHVLEELCGIPVSVEIASEMRGRRFLVDKNTLVIAVSQSGETADTIAAILEASHSGALTMGITNRPDSHLAQLTRNLIVTECGIEVSVAATKTFTAQVLSFYLFSLWLAESRQHIDAQRAREVKSQLLTLPTLQEQILADEKSIQIKSLKYAEAQDVVFMGRGINFPVSLEGALKLKELSYIHASGYAAGELKHGPIAVLDSKVPVVTIIVPGLVYEKMLSNSQEARARNAQMIAIACDGDKNAQKYFDTVISIPKVDEFVSPLLTVLPIQLFSYFIADYLGKDVDQPRNLAKSVTVE